MPQPRNKTLEQKARRKEVAARRLRGEFQSAIAEAMGIAQGTVSKDLKAIHAEWAACAIRDAGTLKNLEVARLDEIERRAWQEYERSREARKSTRVKSEPDKDGKPVPVESTTEIEERTGNPRYLEVIKACVQQRCRILGIEAPQEITGPGGGPLQITSIRIIQPETVPDADDDKPQG